MRPIPVAVLTGAAQDVMDDLAAKLSKSFGVTLQGTHLTVRWKRHGKLVQATLLVDSVDDGEEDDDSDLEK